MCCIYASIESLLGLQTNISGAPALLHRLVSKASIMTSSEEVTTVLATQLEVEHVVNITVPGEDAVAAASAREELPPTITAGAMHKFPHIDSLDKMARQMKYVPGELPTRLRFQGTVKLHGTHADIVQAAPGGPLQLQTRNRILQEPDEDFHGLRKLVMGSGAGLRVMAQVREALGPEGGGGGIMISGELCGSGIQKGTAVCLLPKLFVIFDIWANGRFQDMSKVGHIHDAPSRVYNIRQFPTYEVEINTDDIEAAKDAITLMTVEVARSCPVGMQLGLEGRGEGIVWKCVHGQLAGNSRLWFKSKAEEFFMSSKAPREPRADPLGEGVREAAEQFVADCVTEQRLLQGLEYLREFNHPIERSSLGHFIKWVVEDTLREEGGDIAAGLLPTYRKGITMKAKAWFMERA